MNGVIVKTYKEKCRSYGKCLKVAPDLFVLDADRKVDLLPVLDIPGDLALKGAKSCPYRAIAVFDEATGDAVFPLVRK